MAYNRARLLSDPVYNMQMGAAELANLLGGYNGSYILTFAGYNAGRGRVRQWIAAYGDPRDPKVDPVDWVERIPIAETRNYVQRIMENLQVYRARFGGGTKLMIEADLKRGGGELRSQRSHRRPLRSHMHSMHECPTRRHLHLHLRPRRPAAACALLWRAQRAALPVVCLPGLARTAADFDALAKRWRATRAGRAASSRSIIAAAANPTTTAIRPITTSRSSSPTCSRSSTALDAVPAIFVGTSRGGILAMLLAAVRPSAIAGVVLNDIGPVIEPKGLMRIKGYVGKLPQPRSFEEGAEILRRLFDAQFPKLGPDDWLASARRTFRQENGALVPTYDVKLAKTLEGVDFEKPLPPLWEQFDALRHSAGDGDPRRQFRHPVARNGRGDARAPRQPGDARGARSGPCAAVGGSRRDRAHRGFCRTMRALIVARATRREPFFNSTQQYVGGQPFFSWDNDMRLAPNQPDGVRGLARHRSERRRKRRLALAVCREGRPCVVDTASGAVTISARRAGGAR